MSPIIKLSLGIWALALAGCGGPADGDQSSTAEQPPASPARPQFMIIDDPGGTPGGSCPFGICQVVRFICVEWEYDQYGRRVSCLQSESYIDDVCCDW